MQAEIIDENFVFKTMDKIMQQCTMYDFCKGIEIFFSEMFDCERVNVVLVHRVKKFLYRIEPDTAPGTYKHVKFPLQAGIAGFVCISSHSLVTEAVQSENKFSKEIDDPKGTEENPAIQMVSCPINTTNDFQQMNKEGLTNYPRAII